MYRSIGDIGKEIGVTAARVDHVVRTRGVPFVATAGGTRLFDDAALERIKHEFAVLPKPGRPRRVPATV